MDDSKVNSGFFDGLVKSKKFGLTTTFITACFGIIPTVASELVQIVFLSAATLMGLGYLISQGIVEAAWGHAAEEVEEEPVELQATVAVPATTTTLGRKSSN